MPAQSEMAPPAIEARGLERTFKGGVEAVRGVDLSVAGGEVFGFLGPNGAGKTTTVRMLCTLLPPTAGSARVAGVDVLRDGAEVRRRIGVALQEIGLDPIQTGRELLELQCGLYGITGAAARKRAKELLELLGIADAADRRTKTYSGGMKRRLDLASALVHSPDVLFLDEPTTGLDPASRLTVWDEVRRINASGTTVFLTTQYLEEADNLCNRLAIIDDGEIVTEGTPAELKAKMGHDVVSVSLDGADPSATGAALDGLPGLERVVAEPDALALYVEDGASSIAAIVRRLALVTEIDLGYFDKLRVAPIRRSSIIFGRLSADLVRGILTSTVVLLAGIAFGARIQSGVAGALLIVLLSALFGVAYAGFGILVALRTRNVQATQSSFLLFFPLLFLTPNFVPFDRLESVMQTLARINPLSYVIVGLRSLVIDGWDAGRIGVSILVVAAMGAILTALSLRAIATYDR